MRSIKTCLRRTTLIHFLNIDLMIIALMSRITHVKWFWSLDYIPWQSNSKDVCNLTLIQSTTSSKTSLPHSKINLIEFLRRTSFDISNHLQELLSYFSKTATFGCLWTIMAKKISHQEPVSIAVYFQTSYKLDKAKIHTKIDFCVMYNQAHLKKDKNKRWRSKLGMNILNTMSYLLVLPTHYHLSTLDEQCVSKFFRLSLLSRISKNEQEHINHS